MSKHHAADDLPQASDSWIHSLGTGVNPVPAQRLPYYSSLIPRTPSHADLSDEPVARPDPQVADRTPDITAPGSPGAGATGPEQAVSRLSADRIDRLIDRLDGAGDGGAGDGRAVPQEATAQDVVPEVPGEALPDGAATDDADEHEPAPIEPKAAATESDPSPTNPAPAGDGAPVAATSLSGSRRAGRVLARKPLLTVAAAALCVLTVGGGLVARNSSSTPHTAAIGSAPPSAAQQQGVASPSGSGVAALGADLAGVADLAPVQPQVGAQAAPLVAANRSRAIPLGGAAKTAPSVRRVSLAVGGRPATSTTTSASTVGGLLAQQNITVGPLDKVTPALSTPLSSGLSVRIDRIVVRSIAGISVIAEPAATVVLDAALAKGTTKVVQQGRPGRAAITYRVTTVNGRQTAKTVSARRTVVPAVATVTHLGTKVAPKSTFTYSGSEVFTNDTTFGVNWDGLAMCESTHNPRAINANPSAGLPTYGLFQFDLPTWESVGGSGNPIDASPQEQLMRAKLLYQQRGLEPWACRDAAH